MHSIFSLMERAKKAKVSVSEPFTIWCNDQVYASFPTLVRTPEGLLMAFRIAPREPVVFNTTASFAQHLHPRSMVAFCKLDSEYAGGDIDFLEPDLFAADQDPNLVCLSNGSLLMTSFSWRPLVGDKIQTDVSAGVFNEASSGVSSLFWGGFSSLSLDNGAHWTSRVYLPELPGFPDIVPQRRPWHGGRHRGQAVEMPDGRILVASYDRNPADKVNSSHLHVSLDCGQSWEYAGIIASDPAGRVGYAEPTLVFLDNGQLLALHRTSGADDCLAISRSLDAGRTWQPPEITDVTGHPFHTVRLKNGLMVLLYAVRQIPSSIRARLMDTRTGAISADEITLRTGGEVKDIGYPTGIETTADGLLVAYYWVDSSGMRYIEGVSLEFS
jgi:hypothetical protein